MPTSFINGTKPASAYESITVSTTAVGLTSTNVRQFDATTKVRKEMYEAFITVEDNPLRYRLDGTNPTSSEGHLLQVGDSLTVTGLSNLTRFKGIRTGAADAVLKVTFFG